MNEIDRVPATPGLNAVRDADCLAPGSDCVVFAPEPPKPTLERLFFGKDGLRAGWSFALFLILCVALGFLFTFVVFRFHILPRPPKDIATMPMSPIFTMLSDGSQFFIAALAAWLMSLIERRPWSRYGITALRAVPDFFAGLFWGFVCLSTLIGLLLLTHTIAFDGLALHGAVAAAFGAKWLLGFLCVGLSEEFITRGYIQYTVSRGVAGITRAMDPTNRYSHAIGFWVTAFLFSALLFMAAHLGNKGETPWGILQVGMAGGVFAFSLWRTGSLWWAIGFHCSWDWAQSYFYGTHDSGLAAAGHFLNSHPTGNAMLSGGSTGPEGSILCTPIFLLIAAIIHFTLPRRNYPLTPDQTPLP
jgi:membrane protease YdiL (CAAX protease family)